MTVQIEKEERRLKIYNFTSRQIKIKQIKDIFGEKKDKEEKLFEKGNRKSVSCLFIGLICF